MYTGCRFCVQLHWYIHSCCASTVSTVSCSIIKYKYEDTKMLFQACFSNLPGSSVCFPSSQYNDITSLACSFKDISYLFRDILKVIIPGSKIHSFLENFVHLKISDISADHIDISKCQQGACIYKYPDRAEDMRG